MTCAACGAPTKRENAFCAICGFTANGTSAVNQWDRTPEAEAYEDLSHALEEGETLLGACRGRLVGNWKPRFVLNPRAWISPFANVGLTNRRMLLQSIDQGTGAAASSGAVGIPMEQIGGVEAGDAESMGPGETVRLTVHLGSGEQFRLRATGRLASQARELAEVWQSLYGNMSGAVEATVCAGCSRALDRSHRFCPYCGASQESQE